MKVLLKNGYDFKIGYFIKPKSTISTNYSANKFIGFSKIKSRKSKVAVVS